MYEPSPEDIAAARKEGDLTALLLMAAGIAPKAPKQRQAEPEKPCFHIRRPGAWPCGTAASGPTPPPCNDCQNRKEAA
ncbi:hypothetical protein OHA04_37445 [Streptomyces sp. NBC_01590]|uniref:hypothetical protein n=1 Tax=Streptomyces sp. NBC_01590 TaxID=2975887 RepID=UPI0038682556